MDKIVRYVIQMSNGEYMKEEFEDSLERLRIHSVENPIDATLLRKKNVAERIIKEVIDGDSNLLVLYDDDNPPIKVVKLEIQLIVNTDLQ